ncbi:MAG: flagellar biosynthesis protein FlhF [Spirochaetia bacterium]|jgi:flagellar biosynthesis protein FlhF|nr:flagellar biosynthesis protein FlhF [Spirochaetia bacterium]
MAYQMFTLQAATYEDACVQARSRYGELVRVHQQKPVRVGGVLGFFTRPAVEVTGFFPDPATKPLPAAAPAGVERDLEEVKREILSRAPPKQDENMKEVLRAIQSLRETFDSGTAASARKDAHPSIRKIRGLLYENDFSPAYAEKIADRIKKESSLEELENFDALQDRVVDWIGESISIYDTREIGKSQVYILVGPTGVGKTTTIAKLAAKYGIIAADPLDVRILTIDDFRIGAKEQIETYGKCMHIPVDIITTREEFKKKLAIYHDVDMIFVDTIGKSPRDFVTLGEMRELLDVAFKKASVHLALSATTKSLDLVEIMQQFEPFGYESLVITKLDETPRVGSLISAAAEKGKALSFITDGQRVPENIKAATVKQFLQRLTGFRLHGEHIEEKFGEKKEFEEE